MASSDGSTALTGQEIHRQHLEIFEALDALRDVYVAGRDLDRLSLAFDQLFERTRAHFLDEEALLERQRHPKLDAHRQAHALILEHMAALRKDLDRIAGTQFLPQMRFVDYWLTNHVFDENARLI